MDLGPEIFRTNGRAARPCTGTVVRSIDANDLVLLGDEKGSKPSALKRLSERHHALARALAAGMSPSDAAITCGYVLSRVSILQDDPAFKELLQFYRANVEAEYRDLHMRLSGISMDAAEILQERLEEEPDKVSVGQLMELVKLGADRTGYGPSSSSTNINLNVGVADRLQAARARVAARRQITLGDPDGTAE